MNKLKYITSDNIEYILTKEMCSLSQKLNDIYNIFENEFIDQTINSKQFDYIYQYLNYYQSHENNLNNLNEWDNIFFKLNNDFYEFNNFEKIKNIINHCKFIIDLSELFIIIELSDKCAFIIAEIINNSYKLINNELNEYDIIINLFNLKEEFADSNKDDFKDLIKYLKNV